MSVRVAHLCSLISALPAVPQHALPRQQTGNLYYALTHSPEPMSAEYSYALTWEAATERFEIAGCIPLKEAQQYDRWVESGTSGVEVRLECATAC